ncbi:hypothetical protein MD484_g8865, partial [Candolleomyces efflorescens]
MNAPKLTWKASLLRCSTDPPGLERLRDYVANTRDFDPVILDTVLPLLRPSRLPSKKIQSHLPRNAALEILLYVEQARLSIEVISSLCRAFPHDPDGEDVARKEALTEKLLANLEPLVEWADVLCIAGYVKTSAVLLYELWRYHAAFPPKFRHSTQVVDVLFSLLLAKDKPTDVYLLSFGDRVCPLVDLFLLLSLDEESRDLVQTALAKISNKQILAILYTFRERMEETVRLHGKGKVSLEFSVKHLARLGRLLHFIIPSDTRRYWGRFLLREGLLKTLFGSVLSLMPIEQANACWADVISAVRLVSCFVLEAGEYSANPISKMAAAVSGGVVPLLLGAIVHLDPSDKTLYDAALALLSLREDWELHHRQECPLLFPLYWSRQLNQWLPGHAKADILAFVEDFWTYRCDIVKHAKAIFQIPTNSHYVGKLTIDTLPPKLSLIPAMAYTQPSCKNVAFESRMKTYTEQFLLNPEHQLVEIRFSFGNSIHRALVDLQLAENGAWKAKSGAFGF